MPTTPKKLAMPRNFPPHISKVPYKDLPTQKHYVMKVGLFSSTWDGTTLTPEYGFIVYEKPTVPVVSAMDDAQTQMQIETLEIFR